MAIKKDTKFWIQKRKSVAIMLGLFFVCILIAIAIAIIIATSNK